MKKELVPVTLLVLLLFFSSGAYAAGLSSGNSNPRASNVDVTTAGADSSLGVTNKVDCEANPDRKGRIRCRFANRGNILETDKPRIEEACRNHPKKSACEALHQRSEECYSLTGNDKKACFLKKAGINQGQLIRHANSDKKRDYLILVLYEVQERVEDLEESGEISTEDATSIVDLIIEIKKDILDGETRQIIKPKIRELRKMFFNARQ